VFGAGRRGYLGGTRFCWSPLGGVTSRSTVVIASNTDGRMIVLPVAFPAAAAKGAPAGERRKTFYGCRSAKSPHAFQHRPAKNRRGRRLEARRPRLTLTPAAYIPLLIHGLVHLKEVLVHLLDSLVRGVNGCL
jgi:hypothetical protein